MEASSLDKSNAVLQRPVPRPRNNRPPALQAEAPPTPPPPAVEEPLVPPPAAEAPLSLPPKKKPIPAPRARASVLIKETELVERQVIGDEHNYVEQARCARDHAKTTARPAAAPAISPSPSASSLVLRASPTFFSRSLSASVASTSSSSSSLTSVVSFFSAPIARLRNRAFRGRPKRVLPVDDLRAPAAACAAGSLPSLIKAVVKLPQARGIGRFRAIESRYAAVPLSRMLAEKILALSPAEFRAELAVQQNVLLRAAQALVSAGSEAPHDVVDFLTAMLAGSDGQALAYLRMLPLFAHLLRHQRIKPCSSVDLAVDLLRPSCQVLMCAPTASSTTSASRRGYGTLEAETPAKDCYQRLFGRLTHAGLVVGELAEGNLDAGIDFGQHVAAEAGSRRIVMVAVVDFDYRGAADDTRRCNLRLALARCGALGIRAIVAVVAGERARKSPRPFLLSNSRTTTVFTYCHPEEEARANETDMALLRAIEDAGAATATISGTSEADV